MTEMGGSKSPYGYVPEHRKERETKWRSLSICERLTFVSELSQACLGEDRCRPRSQ